jgi:hypothetical protein
MVNIERDHMSNALRGKAFLPKTCATTVDHELFGDDPNFAGRWTKRVRLTYDPVRQQEFIKVGLTADVLQKEWHLTTQLYAWQKIVGNSWIDGVRWKTLTELISGNDAWSKLFKLLKVADEQFQLVKPAVDIKPRTPDPLPPKEHQAPGRKVKRNAAE